MMQPVVSILEFWLFALATLGAALGLLNALYGLVDGAVAWHGWPRETFIAGLASLVEGIGLWLAVGFAPAGGLVLVLPALSVGVIYQLSHFAGWRRYEILWLIVFQLVLSGLGAALMTGRLLAGAILAAIFAGILAATVGILRAL